MKSTRVYVDGFNFYHGAVKHSPEFKWLDFHAFSRELLRGYGIELVKYFTARLEDRPDDPTISQRQDIFLQALEAQADLEVYLGHFRTNKKKVLLAERNKRGNRTKRTALVTEEKGSDVNLGSHLVWDACHQEMKAALVMSNDSDLQTPVDMAMQLGVEVITFNPHYRDGQPDHLHGTGRRRSTKRHMRRSLLPDPVVDRDGRLLHKPATWV